jgi:catechol 2,3-dioxygenase-like lactoylglutathione lyase family enzyme
MINRIQHAAISTGDMARALEFYRDLLGFELLSDATWERGSPASANAQQIMDLEDVSVRAVMLRLGDTLLELFEFESPRPAPAEPNRPVCDHGYTHICLDVTDMETEYERLKRDGMRFHCPPMQLGRSTKVTYGRDPDGNVIELYERLKR